jgi:hypothetical protein
MTNNEAQFVESIVNHRAHISKTQDYIAENYNVCSEFCEDENTLYLWTTNVNESLQILAAKEYVENKIGSDKVQILYDKK